VAVVGGGDPPSGVAVPSCASLEWLTTRRGGLSKGLLKIPRQSRNVPKGGAEMHVFL
jgi:hypothetical protein